MWGMARLREGRVDVRHWIIAIAVAVIYLAVSVTTKAWQWTWLIWVGYAAYRFWDNYRNTRREDGR